MRFSDGSSDVCSSDLAVLPEACRNPPPAPGSRWRTRRRGRRPRSWRGYLKCGKGAWSFSCLFGGEVVDGVTALRVEAGDARARVDATREAAPGTAHDHVDGFGTQPTRVGVAPFLPTTDARRVGDKYVV